MIGLREGLEAGLVVSILFAALRKANAGVGADEGSDRRPVSSAAIWLGVLGAVTVAGSFAAVLTYSTEALSSSAQEAVGGLLSVIAVGLVTAMVFWMRRTARFLSAQLRGEVARAVAIGAGALTLTAFLAVGREGLETTLFIWTAVKASGSTVAPLVGAALGLATAVVLCWLLYRQAVKLNLGTFFNRTAIALIVVAAGVLAYGLGDLQDAGWLPGQRWVAFDLTRHVDPNAWWVSVVSGVTELSPRMTVLQVVAWAVYLGVVIPVFVRAGRAPVVTPAVAPAPPPAPESAAAPAPVAADAVEPRGPGRWERLLARRTWPVVGTLVVVPVAAAATVIALLPVGDASATTSVTVTPTACASEWTSGHTGNQTFEVDNKSGKAGEVNLDNAAGAVVGEIETLGPATTAGLTATLGPGTYSFVCLMSGGTLHGQPVQVSGTASRSSTLAFRPVTLRDLVGPNREYQRYAAADLVRVVHDVRTLGNTLRTGSRAQAEAAWLAAQLAWERVAASYDSFGRAGLAVDDLPDGIRRGVHSPRFIGLHRVEYGLYHGQSAARLAPVVDRLLADLAVVRRGLTGDDEAGDPTNLPLRVHEVLEDAQRDHLSGIDDEGAHMAYAETYADSQVTRTLLLEVAPLIRARDPQLLPRVTRQLDRLQAALRATRAHSRWQPAGAVPIAARQRVDGTIGALLESLAIEPNLLEVPPTP
ncbi:MAG: FTR1 family protein [Nocardioides sp.]